jgi:hypothetical protein
MSERPTPQSDQQPSSSPQTSERSVGLSQERAALEAMAATASAAARRAALEARIADPSGPAPKSLDEVDPELLRTYAKLGIPLVEQEILAGVEKPLAQTDPSKSTILERMDRRSILDKMDRVEAAAALAAEEASAIRKDLDYLDQYEQWNETTTDTRKIIYRIALAIVMLACVITLIVLNGGDITDVTILECALALIIGATIRLLVSPADSLPHFNISSLGRPAPLRRRVRLQPSPGPPQRSPPTPSQMPPQIARPRESPLTARPEPARPERPSEMP